MGLNNSKVLLSSVNTSQLAVKSKNLIISPRLCTSVFQKYNRHCRQNDFQELVKYLQSPHNTRKPKRTLSKKCEKDLIKCIDWPMPIPLKAKTENYLCEILMHLKNVEGENKPLLLAKYIEPELERMFQDNVNLQKRKARSGWFSWILSLFYYQISPSNLRRNPKLASVKGLDRSHKFSLDLAVKLWSHFYGHKYVTENILKQLRKCLNHQSNIYLTCKFTNKVTHVKFDNEIYESILSRKPLSSGARIRARQILSWLVQTKNHQNYTHKLDEFLARSADEIKRLV